MTPLSTCPRLSKPWRPDSRKQEMMFPAWKGHVPNNSAIASSPSLQLETSAVTDFRLAMKTQPV